MHDSPAPSDGGADRQAQPEPGSIGLVLSGGGVRGLAHVGVIQEFRRAGLEITHYSGASAGALVGVMAAADASIDDMLDFWLESRPFERDKLAGIETPGLFDTSAYVDTLRAFVEHERFEDLPHRLTVVASAMARGRPEYFDRGPLWPIVIASASYPLVFSPIRIDGEVYMDGGITDNFPVTPLRGRCERIIGINVSPRRAVPAESLDGVRPLLERTMDMQFGVDTEGASKGLDLMITPEGIEAFGVFDTEAALTIYQRGVAAGEAALRALDEWL